MTPFLLRLVANPIISALWKPVAFILGILTFGYLKKREGAAGANAKRAAADAKAREKTVKEVLNETVSDDPADDIRRRMRERAGK